MITNRLNIFYKQPTDFSPGRIKSINKTDFANDGGLELELNDVFNINSVGSRIESLLGHIVAKQSIHC